MADRTVWGTVTSAGGIGSGTGFKVTNDKNGTYSVLFDTPFSVGPSVVVTQVYSAENNDGGDTRDNAVIVYIENARFKVVTGQDDGSKVNRSFAFIAVGQ